MEVGEEESGGDALREMSRKEEQGRIDKELKTTVTKSVSVTDWPLYCVTAPKSSGFHTQQSSWLCHLSQRRFFWFWLGSFLSLWSAVGPGGTLCSPRLDSAHVWGSASCRLVQDGLSLGGRVLLLDPD